VVSFPPVSPPRPYTPPSPHPYAPLDKRLNTGKTKPWLWETIHKDVIFISSQVTSCSLLQNSDMLYVTSKKYTYKIRVRCGIMRATCPSIVDKYIHLYSFSCGGDQHSPRHKIHKHTYFRLNAPTISLIHRPPYFVKYCTILSSTFQRQFWLC